MRLYKGASRVQGHVVQLVTDRWKVIFKQPRPIGKGEVIRFELDEEWAVAVVAPHVEPTPGRKTLYPVPLVREQ